MILNQVWRYRRSNLGQVTYRRTKGIAYGINRILDIMVQPIKDLRGICRNQYGHPGSAIGYSPERRLGHVYIIPEPVGSARLTFVDDIVLYELCELVTECCSESRMRSRTSRGVSEWSRGKDLYMGSHILGFGKRCSFFGIVPGSFQKVPEDSGGVHKSTSGSTMTQGLAWAVERRPSLIGLGAPSPQKPMWLGKAREG